MRRVLVIGASGMLGHRLILELAGRDGLELHATVRAPVPRPFRPPGVAYHEQVALGSGTGPIARILEAVAPDIVINAAGAIKQKQLDDAVDQTLQLNGALPHALALLNPNPDGRVIHISTDCVFRGDRGSYRQDEVPDANDLYGRSKAIGELNYGPHLTLRTSIVGFEIGGHLGLISWLFKQPRGSRLQGYTQAVYSGLTTGALSRTITGLLNDDVPRGLWQIAAEPITKYDLLTRLNVAFSLGHDLVPDDSVRIDRTLEDTPWRRLTGTFRPAWDTLINDLREDWRQRPYAEIYSSLTHRTGAATT